ncbi:MAG: hypothetical protein NT009_08665 [Proteobacteria bacterium]|nr:hypothetical protein [Pseudomonadota bacterium]
MNDSLEKNPLVENKKLSKGVCFVIILFTLFGIYLIISFLLPYKPPEKISGHYLNFSYSLIKANQGTLISLILGILFIVGGVGMFRKKLWALRIIQIMTILFSLILVSGSLIFLIIAIQKNYPIDKLFLLHISFPFTIILILVFVILIIFLFKKSTIDQFKASIPEKDQGQIA